MMNKRSRLVLSAIGLLVFGTLSLLVIVLILKGPERSELPEYPDFHTISKTLKDQIKGAGFKTYINPTVDNLGNLGMVYHSCAYYDKAALCYQLAAKKSLRKNKREWIWNYYLGYLSLEQGDSKAVIENLTRVIEKNPRNYQALYYMGEAWQNLGSISNAENIFKRIAGLNSFDFDIKKTNREYDYPLHTYAMFQLGRIYLNSNRLDSAETVLKETIRRRWTFGPAYRLLGEVYKKMGSSDLSKKFIIRSNDLAEYSPPTDTLIDKIALLSRSEQYLLKQIEDAKMSYNFNWELKLCTHSMKYIPDNKYLISNIILLYFTLSKDKEVLPLLEQHIKYFGDDFEELMKLADLLYSKGFESQAMTYFNQAKKIDLGASRLALWLLLRGKNNDAVMLLSDQLKRDPNNERILIDAVHIYLSLGDKEKAIKYLAYLKQHYPENMEAKKETGLLFEMEGKMKEALSIYEEVVKSGAKDLSIYKYLATIYFRDKLWDKAFQNFRQALNDFPNDPDLLNELGSLLISCPDQNLRNINEGKEYSERSFIHFKSSPPNRIMAAKNIATACAMLGDKQTAFRFINITLDMVIKGGSQANISYQDLVSYFKGLKNQYNIQF
jgi:tetratricopeptide (TPR) repeat protein